MDTAERGKLPASMIGGVILVLLGALFLLQQFANFDIGWIVWPFFVIIPGVGFLAAMALGGKGAGWLAIPGSIVTAVGLILLFQSLTGRYETWSYAWALVGPFAAGVGTVLMGLRDDQPSQVAAGRSLVMIGLALFLAFGAFFELIIFRNTLAAGVIWPLVLIAAGIVLLVWQSRRPARA